MPHRPVGVGHLTMLDAAPPDWVQLAHDAGFEAVGIRIGPASPTEEPWPMTPGSPMLAATLERLAATGVLVQDVEIISITPQTRAEQYEPLFDVGARRGAPGRNRLVTDPDVPDLVRLVAVGGEPHKRYAPAFGVANLLAELLRARRDLGGDATGPERGRDLGAGGA